MDEKKSLYDQLGGHPVLQKVAKLFYDKVYEDEWLGQYFKHISQEHIEAQQVDFMAQALGGPKMYCGRMPGPAHTHIFITKELFDLRHQLLIAALRESNVPEELTEKWIKIDGAFEHLLVRNSVSECEKRFFTDEILNFFKPGKKAA